MRKTNKKYPESFFDTLYYAKAILSAIFKPTNVSYQFPGAPRVRFCVLGTDDAPLFLDKVGLLFHLISSN
jgi:hypothetical protein